MRLIWIAAILSISTSFFMSHLLVDDLAQVTGNPADASLWWKLAGIISCGTLAAVLIPEFTKFFTSSHSKHVQEIVTASRGWTNLSMFFRGLLRRKFFGAFWTGLLIVGLMTIAYFISGLGLTSILGPHATIFAFGLVAFGFLCMGHITIAVDSYGHL